MYVFEPPNTATYNLKLGGAGAVNRVTVLGGPGGHEGRLYIVQCKVLFNNELS